MKKFFSFKKTLVTLLLLSFHGISFADNIVPNASSTIANYTNNTVENLQYTSYKLGGRRFDASKGIYVLDCSSYVDHILKASCPTAYHKLVSMTGSLEPTSRDYYQFFRSLPKDNKPRTWNKVDNVKSLHPGDILVFRFLNRSTAGHVMVVMNRPIQNINSFSVRVADSAVAPHSKDTRAQDDSGVGIGTMLLKTNSVGKPYAYAWQEGSHWERHVQIAMARPLDIRAMSGAVRMTPVVAVYPIKIQAASHIHKKQLVTHHSAKTQLAKSRRYKHKARLAKKKHHHHYANNDASLPTLPLSGEVV